MEVAVKVKRVAVDVKRIKLILEITRKMVKVYLCMLESDVGNKEPSLMLGERGGWCVTHRSRHAC